MKRELPWKLEITRATNGYVIEWDEEIEDRVVRRMVDVVESDEDQGDLESMQQVLWIVAEHFAVYTGISVIRDDEECTSSGT